MEFVGSQSKTCLLTVTSAQICTNMSTQDVACCSEKFHLHFLCSQRSSLAVYGCKCFIVVFRFVLMSAHPIFSAPVSEERWELVEMKRFFWLSLSLGLHAQNYYIPSLF